jgi:hypothetical protein
MDEEKIVQEPDYTEQERLIALQQQANEDAKRALENALLKEALAIGDRNAAQWGELISAGMERLDQSQNRLQKAVADEIAAMQNSNATLQAAINAEVAKIMDKTAQAAAIAAKRIADTGDLAAKNIQAAQEREEQAIEQAGRAAIREINRVADEADRRDRNRKYSYWLLLLGQFVTFAVSVMLFYKIFR